MSFTLHTDPEVSVPEFTLSCLTRGGPATYVHWSKSHKSFDLTELSNNTNQIILDPSKNSVYDNKLRATGRNHSIYMCIITNINPVMAMASLEVTGVWIDQLRTLVSFLSYAIKVAGKPTYLTAVASHSNNTHVNITVAWVSPGDPVTHGYVIYYQPKGGPVISDSVFGGETDTHSLDGLHRGVTYYISLVALSPHLPSPLVGPITVASRSLPTSLFFQSSCILCHALSSTNGRDVAQITHNLK